MFMLVKHEAANPVSASSTAVDSITSIHHNLFEQPESARLVVVSQAGNGMHSKHLTLCLGGMGGRYRFKQQDTRMDKLEQNISTTGASKWAGCRPVNLRNNEVRKECKLANNVHANTSP